eukprot:snap_masked-scaffold_8-processed-gene-13.35-mRNA-1 protein AED:0.13 eAED:0.13 QI:0/-1/0/1/-1/1/1/0/91
MLSFEKVEDFKVDEKGKVILFDDPQKNLDARAQRVREKAIAVQQAILIRNELTKCYRREGVNHYQLCKDLAQKYVDVIRKPDFGAAFHPQN